MRAGRIVVITGPMFSGKSLMAISRIEKALNGGRKVQAFRPNVPGRDTLPGEETHIVSRFGASYPATTIYDYSRFFDLLDPDTDEVVIDEAQFCDMAIVDIVRELRRRGKNVTILGLDLDVFENPFGPMPFLMALAQEVIKVTAACAHCGGEAEISYRLTGGTEQIQIGDREYIALCYTCYYEVKGLLPKVRPAEDLSVHAAEARREAS